MVDTTDASPSDTEMVQKIRPAASLTVSRQWLLGSSRRDCLLVMGVVCLHLA